MELSVPEYTTLYIPCSEVRLVADKNVVKNSSIRKVRSHEQESFAHLMLVLAVYFHN